MENTTEMSEESPYYFKLERHDKVEGTADKNPYYYKLDKQNWQNQNPVEF